MQDEGARPSEGSEAAIAATLDPRLRAHRDFATLFVGATLSRLSTEMYSVAVVLYVLAETHSAQVAGFTVAAATLPTVVTGPLVGAWLDRSAHRRIVFLASPLLLAVAMAGFLAVGKHAGDGALVAMGFV